MLEPDGSTRSLLLHPRPIAQGAFATLWTVAEKDPDGKVQKFAVKRILIDANNKEHEIDLAREVDAMRRLPPHPNVLQLHGWFQRAQNEQYNEAFLLLELCDGSLAHLLQRHAMPAPAPDASKLPGAMALTALDTVVAFQDMLHAVAHLQAQSPPMTHRDIKPENFLLSRDGRWKLCDFGSATWESPFVFTKDMSSTTLAVQEERIHATSTPQYRAPEMCDLRRGHSVGPQVDIWALGVTLYKMVFLRDLFPPGEEKLGCLNFDPKRALDTQTVLSKLPHPHLPTPVLDFLLNLMRACLMQVPHERPDARELLQWMTAKRSTPGLTEMPLLLNWPIDGSMAVRLESVRGLFGPKLTKAKAYAVINCGGVRRTSLSISVTGIDMIPWRWETIFMAHSRSAIEITLWAVGGLLPDAFLGSVAYSLEGLLIDPLAQAHIPPKWRLLERRSSRSHVQGEICLSFNWCPSLSQPQGTNKAMSASRRFSAVRLRDEKSAQSSTTRIRNANENSEALPAKGKYLVDDDSFWSAWDQVPNAEESVLEAE